MLGDTAEQRVALEGQIFHVQCTNSSEFTIGRQTNFHAPVTIINSTNLQPNETLHSENIIIHDLLWTQDAAKALQAKLLHVQDTEEQYTTKKETIQNDNGPLPQSHAADRKFQYMRTLAKKPLLGCPTFLWLITVIVVFTSLILVVINLISVGESASTSTPSAEDKIWIGDQSHQFFSKKQWGGKNASSHVAIKEPVPFVVISHTAAEFCYETTTCQRIIRDTQKYHMSMTPPFADIAYNFLVGGDGYIYEGRGWGVRSPHTGIVNNKNIDINFIGDFSVYDEPTPTQIDAVKKLLERGVADCHLQEDYTLVAHNATTATLSPGKNVYAIISTWDHFQATPSLKVSRHLGMEPACRKNSTT